jgi:hypothetical protein
MWAKCTNHADFLFGVFKVLKLFFGDQPISEAHHKIGKRIHSTPNSKARLILLIDINPGISLKISIERFDELAKLRFRL